MKRFKEFSKGLFEKNPVFRLLLGMCPTLAVTSYVENGIAMGLATLFVLVCSSFVISIFRNKIPNEVRIPTFIVLIATFVTLADYYLKASFPLLSRQLGPFVPLIVVNCIIFARIEVFSSKNPPLLSLLDAIGMGVGFTLALIIISIVREFFAWGTILNYRIVGDWYTPWIVMALPPGAFITLGVLLGLINIFSKKKRKRE